MSGKLIQSTESDARCFHFFTKARIIAKGTEHPSFHRVETFDEVSILSLTPYLDRGIVCLLCKLNIGTIISIPAEWLQITEDYGNTKD